VLSSLIMAASCATSTSPSSGPAPWQAVRCDSAIGSPAAASDSPGFANRDWKTDFARHCVPLSEITSGGPAPDGLPPLDAPQFYELSRAAGWLQPQEPVIAVVEAGEAKAYPLQILIWHEIINDTVGGRPVVVTFCPLCNTSLVFERRVGGRELTFGTTGNLRYSDLVMWDRQTQSWWQQATGEAIVGELTGTKLRRVSSRVLSFEEFGRGYPAGLVLSREAANDEAKAKTGSGRHYGQNPYAGYDRADTSPIAAFWGNAPLDPRLPPKARVAVATFASPPIAYPIDDLNFAVAVNDLIGGQQVVLLYRGGVASPLDTRATAEGSDVGQASFFDRTVGGRILTFRGGSGKTFSDVETGSEWTVTGASIAGPLRGSQLTALEHEVTYWFIWSVFRPDTQVRRVASFAPPRSPATSGALGSADALSSGEWRRR
jgi:hypothetical protein